MLTRHPYRLVFVLSVVLLASACAESTEGVFGADLYQQSCARCHGGGGEGGVGPAIGAATESELLSDEQLADIIRVGPGTMPGFPGFTNDQVASLVEHMRVLQVAP